MRILKACIVALLITNIIHAQTITEKFIGIESYSITIIVPEKITYCHPWSGACLVPGYEMTWVSGVYTWAGNPFCAEGGLLQEGSPAIDKGEPMTGHHCPKPGSAKNQPRVLVAGWLDSPCQEWFGQGVDQGACEYIPIGQIILQ